HLLFGHNADPSAGHEPRIALPDADGHGCPVLDVGETDFAVAMKNAVEGLVLVTAVIRIGIGFVAAAQTAHVAARRGVGYPGGHVSGLGRIAAVPHFDNVAGIVGRAKVGLDYSVPDIRVEG